MVDYHSVGKKFYDLQGEVRELKLIKKLKLLPPSLHRNPIRCCHKLFARTHGPADVHTHSPAHLHFSCVLLHWPARTSLQQHNAKRLRTRLTFEVEKEVLVDATPTVRQFLQLWVGFVQIAATDALNTGPSS